MISMAIKNPVKHELRGHAWLVSVLGSHEGKIAEQSTSSQGGLQTVIAKAKVIGSFVF